MTWHDAATGLVLWEGELPQAAARPAGQEADVVGDFHDAYGDGVERARHLHHGVVSGEGLEFVGGGDEGQTSKEKTAN